MSPPLAADPGLLGPLGTLARALWYLAWTLAAGGAAWTWLFRADDTEAPWSPAARPILGLGRRAHRLGWIFLVEATVLRFVVAVLATANAGGGASLPTAARHELAGQHGLGWVLVFAALWFARPVVNRLAHATTSSAATDRTDRRNLTALLGAVALGAVLTGRAEAGRTQIAHALFGAVHLASAGVWIGLLTLTIVLWRSAAWQQVTAEHPSCHRAVLAPLSRAALRAGAVVVASGVAEATVTGGGLARWTHTYAALVTVKVVALVVALAVGAQQWRAAHSSRPVRGAVRATWLEGGALVTAGLLAAVLVGVNPSRPAGPKATDPPATAAGAPASSTLLPACQAGGGGTRCDLNDVASAVVAAPATDLPALIGQLCPTEATRPQTYATFTCLGWVGRALVARPAATTDDALAACQALTDTWRAQQCGGGVFTALILSEVSTDPNTAAHAADPVWPCDTVASVMKRPCYLLATTRVLWLDGHDIPAAFHVCDGAESAYRATCYESLGRDATSAAGFSPPGIMLRCGQAGTLGPDACIDGAIRALVFTHHAAAAATLCATAPADDRTHCEATRSAAVVLLG